MKRGTFVVATAAVLSASPSCILAATPRVALHIESDGTAAPGSVDRMVNILTGRLIRTGKFQVVDRARLDAVIKEQGFSNSAYADPNTAAALGKLAGASRILNVTLTVEASDSGGPMITTHQVVASASYTLVGVDTARIINAGGAQGVGERQTPGGAPSPVSQAQLEREAIDACCDDLASQVIEQ